MSQPFLDRRTFLGAATGLGAVSTAAAMGSLVRATDQSEQTKDDVVPWSSGTERPTLQIPVKATDAHHHIYDDRFPLSAKAVLRPSNATVADYRLLQKRLGNSRSVIVQPSTYGVDNSCLLDALKHFGRANARGIAVIDETPRTQI